MIVHAILIKQAMGGLTMWRSSALLRLSITESTFAELTFSTLNITFIVLT